MPRNERVSALEVSYRVVFRALRWCEGVRAGVGVPWTRAERGLILFLILHQNKSTRNCHFLTPSL